MRSIGNDVKSSSSASSITQTHLDDLDEARDTHQAVAIAAEGTARNTAIITAVATETAARNTAIASETTARNTAIASETTARNAAITSAVASETTARNTAIATETTARNTAIATETAARNTAIAAAVATETNARQTEDNNVTEYLMTQLINSDDNGAIQRENAIAEAHTEITSDGYFDKIITTNANISDAGLGSHFATFSHKTMNSVFNYGFMHSSIGNASINCATGGVITFRCNKDPQIQFSTTSAAFGVPIITETAEISDAGWRDVEGFNSTTNSMAVFSHKARANVNDYAFMQHVNGTTYINSPAGAAGLINFRINDTNVASFNTVEANFISPITGISDRRFKKNITIPSPSKNWNDFKLIKIKQYNKVYPNINSDTLRIGVIAQELESIDNPICKNAVRKISIGKTKDPVELAIYKQGTIFTDASGEERSGGFRSVEYEQLYRMNLIITQQLMARVEALELALSKKS